MFQYSACTSVLLVYCALQLNIHQLGNLGDLVITNRHLTVTNGDFGNISVHGVGFAYTAVLCPMVHSALKALMTGAIKANCGSILLIPRVTEPQ